jgi:hypothetical protein
MLSFHEPLDKETRDALSAYDDLTAGLLARRGVTTKEDAEAFLSPSYDAHIGDPLLILNMPKASQRIANAIHTGERITVWSDYDCDGIPGGSLLHDFLKKAGANFDNYIPHRHEEGFGVNIAGVEKLAALGTKVMITICRKARCRQRLRLLTPSKKERPIRFEIFAGAVSHGNFRAPYSRLGKRKGMHGRLRYQLDGRSGFWIWQGFQRLRTWCR